MAEEGVDYTKPEGGYTKGCIEEAIRKWEIEIGTMEIKRDAFYYRKRKKQDCSIRGRKIKIGVSRYLFLSLIDGRSKMIR